MASDTIPHLDDRRSRNETIVQALMIPFGVVVLDVLRHRTPEVPLTDWNQPVQAFLWFANIPIGANHVRQHLAD